MHAKMNLVVLINEGKPDIYHLWQFI